MPTTVSSRSPGTMNPTRQQLDELDALLQRMLELPVAKVESPETAESEETPPVAAPVKSRPSPVSYMVIETASPRPLPLASGFAPQLSPLTPRLVPVTPTPEPQPEVPEAVAPVVEPEQMPPTLTLPHKGGGNSDSPSPLVGEGGGGGAEDEAWVPLRSTWQPSAQTWPPLADSWQQAQSVPLPQPQPEIPLPEESAITPPSFPALPTLTEATPVELVENQPLPTPVVEPRLSLSAEDAPAAPGMMRPLVWINQGFEACLMPLGAPGRWLCGPSGRQFLGFIGLACLAGATAIAICAGLGCTW